MGKTTIEWTGHTENPIRARMKSDPSVVGHYCEKVNSGCTNCYASNLQKRFRMPAFGSGQLRDDVELFLCEKTLERLRKRKKPTTYFLCDMTDMFGDWVKPEWIAAILHTIDCCPQHTFQILTKRPENIKKYWAPYMPVGWWKYDDPDNDHFKDVEPKIRKRIEEKTGVKLTDARYYTRNNVWLLTSVSDQTTADQAIPHILECKELCKYIGLSVEPLVGPVDLKLDSDEIWICPDCRSENVEPDLQGEDGSFWQCLDCGNAELGEPDVKSAIDWCIVGGESGPKARPCNLKWIYDVVDQCEQAGVACFVKQVGANSYFCDYQHDAPVSSPDAVVNCYGDSCSQLTITHPKGGDPAEWGTRIRDVRQFPNGVEHEISS